MTPSFIPGEPLDDPESWPFAVCHEGEVFWRGIGGTRFVYWTPELAEVLADRFEAKGWRDLSEPLRAAIQQSEDYHRTEEAA